MQETISELGDALRERLVVIADEESRRDTERHIARLQDVSDRIERLEQQLPATIHPQLRHFLQRRSYSKALEFVDALEAA